MSECSDDYTTPGSAFLAYVNLIQVKIYPINEV